MFGFAYYRMLNQTCRHSLVALGQVADALEFVARFLVSELSLSARSFVWCSREQYSVYLHELQVLSPSRLCRILQPDTKQHRNGLLRSAFPYT